MPRAHCLETRASTTICATLREPAKASSKETERPTAARRRITLATHTHTHTQPDKVQAEDVEAASGVKAEEVDAASGVKARPRGSVIDELVCGRVDCSVRGRLTSGSLLDGVVEFCCDHPSFTLEYFKHVNMSEY